MPSILIVALAGVLALVHLRASFKVSIAVFIATTFLVPESLIVPGTLASVLVVRVGLWMAIVGTFIRVSRGQLPSWSVRPTRILAAFGVFVVLAYLLGVSRGVYPSRGDVAFDNWFFVLDQLLVLWLATVAVRVLGVRWVAMAVATMTVVVSGVGILERVTGNSYGHFWFEHVAARPLASDVLERRGAALRVRGPASYSLEYAWVLSILFPLVAVLAMRAKTILAMVWPGVVMVAIIWTVTRSVFAGLAIGALFLVLSARGDRRILFSVGIAGLLAVTLYFGTSTVRSPYQSASPESERVRERRLTLITQEMASQPWLGLGLDGLTARNIIGTDSALLTTYASVGVIGLAALIGALGAAIATAGAATVRAGPRLAPIGGAVLGGLTAAVVGMFAFDPLTASFASWNIWMLAAIGVGLYEEVMAERGALEERPIVMNGGRLALPAIGLVAGVFLSVVAPAHVAVQMRIFTLDPTYLTVSRKPNDDYIGRVILETICDAGRNAIGPKIKLDCFDPMNLGPGTGIVRLEAANVRLLSAARLEFVAAAGRVHSNQTVITNGPSSGRPTWARTAPLTGLILGAEAALLLPTFTLRRRRDENDAPRFNGAVTAPA